MKHVDLPPVWLVGFGLLAWAVAEAAGRGPGWLAWPGWALVAVGVAVAIWAAIEFRVSGTSIVPRERASALVEGGPYRFSRNPIYVADLVILAGIALILRAPAAVVLVLPFQQVLLRRFVLPEEAILDEDLGQPYREYKARVRRWI